VPQITVTLSDDVYMAVNQLPKGKKSKFVNACIRDIYVNTCWKRLELVEMFMNGYTGFIQAEKSKILTNEESTILSEAEESGESGYE
jgi:hypothetical protein